MNNVITFPNRNVVEKVDTQVLVNRFTNDVLVPWARNQGVDTSTEKFRLSAAGIMACLQGMLLDV